MPNAEKRAPGWGMYAYNTNNMQSVWLIKNVKKKWHKFNEKLIFIVFGNSWMSKYNE